MHYLCTHLPPPFVRSQFLFGLGQSISYWTIGIVILLASGPAVITFFFYSDLVEFYIGWWMLALLPIPFATSFVIGLAFWIAVFKWLLVGKWTTRTVYMYSMEYLRKWTVDNLMELSMFYLHSGMALVAGGGIRNIDCHSKTNSEIMAKKSFYVFLQTQRLGSRVSDICKIVACAKMSKRKLFFSLTLILFFTPSVVC
jgi:hypothetical protein